MVFDHHPIGRRALSTQLGARPHAEQAILGIGVVAEAARLVLGAVFGRNAAVGVAAAVDVLEQVAHIIVNALSILGAVVYRQRRDADAAGISGGHPIGVHLLHILD